MNRNLPMIIVLGAGLAVSLFACGDDDDTDPGPIGGGTTTSSTTTTTTSSTTSSSSSTTSSTTNTGGTGGSVTCEDTGPGEPNNAPENAVDLGVVSDDDPDPLPTFDGVVAGPNDLDWYTYFGSDDFLAYVDPERSMTAADELRMCAYFWCTATNVFGPPEIGGAGGGGGAGPHTCPPGTEAVTADLSAAQHSGQNLGVAPGCCTEPGTTMFHLGEDLLNDYWVPFTCNDTLLDDDMRVFITIGTHSGAPADTCVGYQVQYHF